jgi:hypothetical protein
MKRAIIQHNFNTGLGDAYLALSNYISVSKILKENDFHIKLVFNLFGNMFFRDEKLLDVFESRCFEVFDEIVFSQEVFREFETSDYTCVWTLNLAHPGAHYYDLFIDKENLEFYKSLNIITERNLTDVVLKGNFFENNLEFSKNLVSNFKNDLENLGITNYVTIYFRSFDLEDGEEHFLRFENAIKNKINEHHDKHVFVCSNSHKFKKFVMDFGFPNTFTWNIENGDSWGGHHLHHKPWDINRDLLYSRTISSIKDMWTLGNSNEIFFTSCYPRYANFLILGAINGKKLTWIDE